MEITSILDVIIGHEFSGCIQIRATIFVSPPDGLIDTPTLLRQLADKLEEPTNPKKGA